MSTLPSSGRLGARGLPQLLLMMRGERYSGALHLEGGRVTKTLRFHQGDPVQVESSLAREGLAEMLQEQGKLSAEDAAKAVRMAADRGCKVEAALVGLKLLAPKDLVLALREASRRRILEAFGWADARFRLDPADTPPAESQALGIDALVLVRDGLAQHWTAEQLLGELGEKINLYPVAREGFAEAARSLSGDPASDPVIAALQPSSPAWSALQGAAAGGVASFWVLDAIGALAFQAEAEEGKEEAEVAEASAEPEAPEIEIVISGATEAKAEDRAPRGGRKQKTASKAHRAAELRKEVLEKYERYQELDYYELLDLEHGADVAQVKRAYLKAAKRFHPDALARLGLEDDLKEKANEVFARIAKAHTVLTDAEQRASYEAQLSGHEEVDAERLAQAETFYRKGEILLKMGNFADALEMLKGAVQLWPEDYAYQSTYGWALYKANGDLGEAREAIEKAISLQADDAVSHQRLAIVLRDLGEAEASKAAAATAKRLDPNVRA